VESGEPVLITRRGRAIAELVPRRAVRDLLWPAVIRLCRLPPGWRACHRFPRSSFNYSDRQAMAQTRGAAKGAGTPQAVRLPQELLDRIDRYAARLEGELHLSVSRSDALRRLLTLALEDAEDTAEAEAILRANEPRVSWEELKSGSFSFQEAETP
jgi:antitoxin (DNA-binding transcriptional repressor) of toxin-antitoxin stability system